MERLEGWIVEDLDGAVPLGYEELGGRVGVGKGRLVGLLVLLKP